VVEIEGSGGHIKEGVDFGDRARYAQNAGHAHEEICEFDLVRLKGLE
jgi:hypothetical protein